MRYQRELDLTALFPSGSSVQPVPSACSDLAAAFHTICSSTFTLPSSGPNSPAAVLSGSGPKDRPQMASVESGGFLPDSKSQRTSDGEKPKTLTEGKMRMKVRIHQLCVYKHMNTLLHFTRKKGDQLWKAFINEQKEIESHLKTLECLKFGSMWARKTECLSCKTSFPSLLLTQVCLYLLPHSNYFACGKL